MFYPDPGSFPVVECDRNALRYLALESLCPGEERETRREMGEGYEEGYEKGDEGGDKEGDEEGDEEGDKEEDRRETRDEDEERDEGDEETRRETRMETRGETRREMKRETRRKTRRETRRERIREVPTMHGLLSQGADANRTGPHHECERGRDPQEQRRRNNEELTGRVFPQPLSTHANLVLLCKSLTAFLM